MATDEALLAEGWREHQAGRLTAAEQRYRQVVERSPGSATAWCYLGLVQFDSRRLEQAVASYERALVLQPAFPVAWSNLANTWNGLRRYAEAEAACRRALQLQPDYGSAWNNLGVSLLPRGRVEESIAAFRRATEVQPGNASFWNNLGGAYHKAGRMDESLQAVERALARDPQDALAHRARGLLWLTQGNWAGGFEEFEWRWRCGDLAGPARPIPRWQGESLQGRTVLAWGEQGLGDTLQFVRYLPGLREQGARVTLACPQGLVPLMERSQLADRVVPLSGACPVADVWVPLMSLPRHAGTRPDSIAPAGRYLKVDEARLQRWRERLRAEAELKVGVVWQGSVSHTGDWQRSYPLRTLEPLWPIPGVTWVCLQKGAGREQFEAVPVASRPQRWREFGAELDAEGAFLDTAAVLTQLDVVLTPDTAIAHLAGAMGVPAWVLLSVAPDWRWLLDRDDTPWYPTLRLYRQREIGDWPGVIQRVAEDLVRRRDDRMRDARQSPG